MMLKDHMRVSLRVSVYRGNLPLFPKTLFGLRSIDCEKCLILAMVIEGWAKYTRACEIRPVLATRLLARGYFRARACISQSRRGTVDLLSSSLFLQFQS